MFLATHGHGVNDNEGAWPWLSFLPLHLRQLRSQDLTVSPLAPSNARRRNFSGSDNLVVEIAILEATSVLTVLAVLDSVHGLLHKIIKVMFNDVSVDKGGDQDQEEDSIFANGVNQHILVLGCPRKSLRN